MLFRSVTGVASVAIMAGLAAMSMVRAEPQAPPAAGAPQGGRGGRASTPPDANGECPKGTTLVRIGSCQAPEFPAPSIVDYRPKSTLVTEAHLVPKAKFPAIDLHGHPGALVTSADGISKLVTDMDKIGLLQGREEMARIVSRYPNVERIICGHLHRAIDVRFGGTIASTSPAPACWRYRAPRRHRCRHRLPESSMCRPQAQHSQSYNKDWKDRCIFQ